MAQFLETSDRPYSTSDLTEKFREFSGGETYCVRYLKQKLIQHFGDRIIFLSRKGLSDIVIMRETSESLILKAYEEKCDSNDGINTMIKAANVVVKDIKAMENNKDAYPLPSELSSEDYGLKFMPETLTTFLKTLRGKMKTDENKKIISIGHAIVQLCRPRCLLAPIQFGLGVQIYTLTSSR